MKVPDFLTKDVLVKIIENGYNFVDFTINNVKVESGVPDGENYCSRVYRVFVDVIDSEKNVERIQLFIKEQLTKDTSEELLENMELFVKEIDMLENILPMLSKIAGGVQFAPKFFHSISEPKVKLIASQDLTEINYHMANRHNSLDYDHCCIALAKLGQMHAASMILAKENPSLMDKYNYGIFHGTVGKKSYIESILGPNFLVLCDSAEKWEGFEEISAKLNKMKDNFWAIVYESDLDKNDGYRVLTHGDFWINNFLFKYDEVTGKPIDTIFVDLTYSHYTSPANDVQYFLNTSPKNEIRESRREDLIRVYYASFERTLSDLNHRVIPTFDDLLVEMRKKEMFGFMSAIFILPLVLMERQSPLGYGIDGLVEPETSKDMINIMITGKSYTETIKLILKRADKLKLFDFE
ncbi:uncharacterized protein LOC129786593 [Lutzomyia longipalpis]|uniref:uncharacterized protein LOC129786593 n=1 Tax=Lutzomyia longipalpis TaxID=7200 RepID=UPI00248357E2|nr:uncharacterized protein LOC129786593 [Lutzomyia longipalpis]